MSKKYILLDCNYLCHRAKYSTGGLSHKGDATGVIYGFLKSLSMFQDLFNTSRFVFCWDSRYSKREEIFPEYKSARRKRRQERTEEENEIEWAFQDQMKKLRTTYLPVIGFENIFIQWGYEADDVIASVCLNSILEDDEAAIITSDKDLYQCISPTIFFYNPQTNKILTLQRFKKKYGIRPSEWVLVKSLAGCSTDNVPGIKRVGEKTAIKYLRGKLKETTKIYQTIGLKKSWKIFTRNMGLVKLPFKGIKTFELKEDEMSEQGWRKVTEMLGMKSIRDRMPFGRKRK